MTDGERLLNEQIEKHREAMCEAAIQLRANGSWSLSTPCVLITEVTAEIIPVSAVGLHLQICNHVSDPVLADFIALAKALGSMEEALNQCINNPDLKAAEEFAEKYDAWRRDVEERGHGQISADDLASFARKSREAFPTELAIISAVKDDQGKLSILTGCVAVSSLLN